MALSNWDRIYWDTEGKSITQPFVYNDIEVSVYKNWVYIKEGEDYIKVQEGVMYYKGIDLYVGRDKETNAVYMVCETGYKHKGNLRMQFGIGTYGYSEFLPDLWEGVREEEVRRFRLWMKTMNADGWYRYEIPKFKDQLRMNQGDMYFSDHLNIVEEDFITEVGKAEKPFMQEILEGDDDDEKDEDM